MEQRGIAKTGYSAILVNENEDVSVDPSLNNQQRNGQSSTINGFQGLNGEVGITLSQINDFLQYDTALLEVDTEQNAPHQERQKNYDLLNNTQGDPDYLRNHQLKQDSEFNDYSYSGYSQFQSSISAAGLSKIEAKDENIHSFPLKYDDKASQETNSTQLLSPHIEKASVYFQKFLNGENLNESESFLQISTPSRGYYMQPVIEEQTPSIRQTNQINTFEGNSNHVNLIQQNQALTIGYLKLKNEINYLSKQFEKQQKLQAVQNERENNQIKLESQRNPKVQKGNSEIQKNEESNIPLKQELEHLRTRVLSLMEEKSESEKRILAQSAQIQQQKELLRLKEQNIEEILQQLKKANHENENLKFDLNHLQYLNSTQQQKGYSANWNCQQKQNGRQAGNYNQQYQYQYNNQKHPVTCSNCTQQIDGSFRVNYSSKLPTESSYAQSVNLTNERKFEFQDKPPRSPQRTLQSIPANVSPQQIKTSLNQQKSSQTYTSKVNVSRINEEIHLLKLSLLNTDQLLKSTKCENEILNDKLIQVSQIKTKLDQSGLNNSMRSQNEMPSKDRNQKSDSFSQINTEPSEALNNTNIQLSKFNNQMDILLDFKQPTNVQSPISHPLDSEDRQLGSRNMNFEQQNTFPRGKIHQDTMIVHSGQKINPERLKFDSQSDSKNQNMNTYQEKIDVNPQSHSQQFIKIKPEKDQNQNLPIQLQSNVNTPVDNNRNYFIHQQKKTGTQGNQLICREQIDQPYFLEKPLSSEVSSNNYRIENTHKLSNVQSPCNSSSLSRPIIKSNSTFSEVTKGIGLSQKGDTLRMLNQQLVELELEKNQIQTVLLKEESSQNGNQFGSSQSVDELKMQIQNIDNQIIEVRSFMIQSSKN